MNDLVEGPSLALVLAAGTGHSLVVLVHLVQVAQGGLHVHDGVLRGYDRGVVGVSGRVSLTSGERIVDGNVRLGRVAASGTGVVVAAAFVGGGGRRHALEGRVAEEQRLGLLPQESGGGGIGLSCGGGGLDDGKRGEHVVLGGLDQRLLAPELLVRAVERAGAGTRGLDKFLEARDAAVRDGRLRAEQRMSSRCSSAQQQAADARGVRVAG